jgi:hypothetical protein
VAPEPMGWRVSVMRLLVSFSTRNSAGPYRSTARL